MSENNKEAIYEKISNRNKEIEKYRKHEDELKRALDYCEKASNGINMLMNAQYEKVKYNCIQAIGEEPDLLSLLQVKYLTLPEVSTSISECIKTGIKGIQEKIEELKYEINMLKNQL